MAKTYKFNRYKTEAKADPFVLELDDNLTISIPPPDGDTVLEIEESRSSRRTLELLCDEHYEQVYDLIRHEPASVLNALVADMVDHFGLMAAPPGGTRASSR
jgi:hypothetical protein